jgi:hypothetical protein
MNEIKKKPVSTKKTVPRGKRLANGELTQSQHRLLQLLITGIEDEPDLLAGRPGT